jgi:hypothetical protein
MSMMSAFIHFRFTKLTNLYLRKYDLASSIMKPWALSFSQYNYIVNNVNIQNIQKESGG